MIGFNIMLLQKGFRHSIYSLALLMVFVNQQSIPLRLASQETQWSIPQKVPLYQADTYPPILVADQQRTIHAFSSQWIGLESDEPVRAIFYNQWTLERGWTRPVDILISPYQDARLTSAYLDSTGVMHITFWGGDNITADIYYAKAPVELVGHASAWSAPRVIGRVAGELEGAALAEDSQGILSVLYYGRTVRNGLYAVSSTDRGETWSTPVAIFFTQYGEPNISQIHIVKGSSGGLHAIWGVYTVSGAGRGIYYAQSMDAIEWNEPVLLEDVEDGFGTQKPNIIEHDGTLFSMYMMPPNKIAMRRSSDNGETWNDATYIFPRHEGVNGEMSLVVDGNNELHLFFGQRIRGSPDIHGMWHSVFVNKRWTEPEAIIKGPRVTDLTNGKGFDPNFAQAAVSQGNTILVTWMTDPAAGFNGIWYSYKQINAPEVSLEQTPEEPVENPTASSSLSLANDPTAVAVTPSEVPAISASVTQIPTNKPLFQNNPSLPLIVGSFSAVLLIFLAIVSGLSRTK
jgi:hypothetical protein